MGPCPGAFRELLLKRPWARGGAIEVLDVDARTWGGPGELVLGAVGAALPDRLPPQSLLGALLQLVVQLRDRVPGVGLRLDREPARMQSPVGSTAHRQQHWPQALPER